MGRFIRPERATALAFPFTALGVVAPCGSKLTWRACAAIIAGASLELWVLTIWGMLQVF